MATPVQIGKRNDLYALKEARRLREQTAATVDRAIDEVERMREHVGRPDYGRLTAMLGKMALDIAKQKEWLVEMWTIRERAKCDLGEDVAARVAILESEMAELKAVLGQVLA